MVSIGGNVKTFHAGGAGEHRVGLFFPVVAVYHALDAVGHDGEAALVGAFERSGPRTE